MKCPRCNETEHEPTAKFCHVCGCQLAELRDDLPNGKRSSKPKIHIYPKWDVVREILRYVFIALFIVPFIIYVGLGIYHGISYLYGKLAGENYIVKIVKDGNSGKYGLYDKEKEQEVLKCEYDSLVHNHEGFCNYFSIWKSGLLGIADSLGHISTDCMLDSVRISSDREDCVLVSYGHDKRGVLSRQGTVILPCEYEIVLWDYQPGTHIFISIDDPANYVGNIIPAKKKSGGQWELFNRQGKRITSDKYDMVRQTCHPDLIKVSRKENSWSYGLINLDGRMVLTCSYNKIFNFSNDRSWVRIGRARKSVDDDLADDKWICIDPHGEVVFSVPGNYTVYGFSHGLAAVGNMDRFSFTDDVMEKMLIGFFNTEGEMVIPMVYHLRKNKNVDGNSYYFPDFNSGSEPRAWISFEGRDGYLTLDGKFHVE